MTWASKPHGGSYCLYLNTRNGLLTKQPLVRKLFAGLIILFLSTILQAQSTDGPRSASSAANGSFTGSSGSWSNPTNALSSGNSYATISLSGNGDYSDYLEITDFGFSLSATDIILGIVVEVERFGSSIKDNQISIIKGGVIGSTDQSLTSNWGGSDPNSYETYGGSTDLWGETWSASDINASDFGVAISVRKQGGGAARTANIDHVRITVYFDIPLPVGLQHFNAETHQGQVHLKWATTWEEGNSHFEVQRAGFDLVFETLGYVPGANHSESTINYEFIDESPIKGRAFYRLIQHDFNGNFAISELVAVDGEQGPAAYTVNPTIIRQPVVLTIKNAPPDEHELILISPSGQKLSSIFPKEPQTVIDPQLFASPGLYIFYLFRNGQKVLSGKLLKS